jgi:hypothetical protein
VAAHRGVRPAGRRGRPGDDIGASAGHRAGRGGLTLPPPRPRAASWAARTAPSGCCRGTG